VEGKATIKRIPQGASREELIVEQQIPSTDLLSISGLCCFHFFVFLHKKMFKIEPFNIFICILIRSRSSDLASYPIWKL
jgi:hypothetical protein